MRDKTELKQPKRHIATAKALVRQTAIKAEQLEASVEEIYQFKARVVLFPRNSDAKLAAPADVPDNTGDFLLA
jgi:hypothetical protein